MATQSRGHGTGSFALFRGFNSRDMPAMVMPSIQDDLMHFLRHHRIRRRVQRALDVAIRNHRQIVLIYEPVESQSSDILRVLSQQEDLAVWQIHSLIPELIHRRTRSQLASGNKAADWLSQSDVLHQFLLVEKRARFRVITQIAEPVQQSVASFLNRFSEIFPRRTPVDVSDQTLNYVFHHRFDHRETINWVDDDFYRALEIDLYTHPFHKENGYAVITHADSETLVIRADLENRKKMSTISLFLGTDDTPDMPDWVTTSRDLQVNEDRIREDFAHRIKLSSELCGELMNSRYARHFFTRQERQRVFARWQTDCDWPSSMIRIA